MPRFQAAVVIGLCLAAGTAVAQQQPNLVPVFSIWDVALGQPVAAIDPQSVALVACGTNGGPPAQPLTRFDDLSTCTPEASDLTEVQFSYDDELDFFARALELEYRVLRGGTSVFAHPVIVSVLVDAQGLAEGIRIVTDDRISDLERRPAVTLAKNFKARFSAWNLACTDLPMQDGEQPAGNQFVHESCAATAPDGSQTLLVESSYLRKRAKTG